MVCDVENLGYAREIFARFLPRAWRRPVTDDELQPILRVVQTELGSGETFRDAIRVGLTAALTSSKFLYLVEPSTTDEVRQLNDYQLASRSSYFLWSSMPDNELFALAAAGKLRDKAVLTAQVDRMIADPKIDRFIDGFARQWLRTDSLLAFAPDKYLYEEYDQRLAERADGPARVRRLASHAGRGLDLRVGIRSLLDPHLRRGR